MTVIDDFDTRWAAWQARGRAHEQRARRTFAVAGAVLLAVVAGLFALLRA